MRTLPPWDLEDVGDLSTDTWSGGLGHVSNCAIGANNSTISFRDRSITVNAAKSALLYDSRSQFLGSRELEVVLIHLWLSRTAKLQTLVNHYHKYQRLCTD